MTAEPGDLREVARLLYAAFCEVLILIDRLERAGILERPESAPKPSETARKLRENGPEPRA